MSVRSREELVEAMPDPEGDPSLRDLVKTPTPTEYREVKGKTPRERLAEAFALTAWAENISGATTDVGTRS